MAWMYFSNGAKDGVGGVINIDSIDAIVQNGDIVSVYVSGSDEPFNIKGETIESIIKRSGIEPRG